MSRIIPFGGDDDEDHLGLNGVCPRYIKWKKRIKSFDFSKRKKGIYI